MIQNIDRSQTRDLRYNELTVSGQWSQGQIESYQTHNSIGTDMKYKVKDHREP